MLLDLISCADCPQDKPDGCNCGVCGSHGGCAWSCDANHADSVRFQYVACILGKSYYVFILKYPFFLMHFLYCFFLVIYKQTCIFLAQTSPATTTTSTTTTTMPTTTTTTATTSTTTTTNGKIP